jgi:ubiquinone/menaquinone biosynthesis C-methylase UbiE
MMTDERKHWDGVYDARAEDELTWFEATPSLSLDLVRTYLEPGEAFIDVGAGASRLVDALIEAGLGPLTALDLSDASLAVSRQRLGSHSDEVAWIKADVTR